MRIVWNKRTLGWFESASEFTGYNRRLALALLERIPQRGGTLLDVGCGAALVDFELAPHFKRVDCVDIAGEAVSYVQERAELMGVKNLFARCADAHALTGRWGTVLALFHGGDTLFKSYFPLVANELLFTTYVESIGGFGPRERKAKKRFNAAEARAQLEGLGVRFEYDELALEHGQPLKGIEDAKAFVSAYTLPMSGAELGAYLAAHLVETGREDFAYYLPAKRRFGLFVVRRGENGG